MRIKLDNSIYKWLTAIKVMKPTNKPNMSTNGVVELDEHTTRLFENGTVFGLILEKLAFIQNFYQEEGEKPVRAPNNMKEVHTPAAKLYNWTLLQESFKQYHMTIDDDVKNLLIAGDLEMNYEILKEIH